MKKTENRKHIYFFVIMLIFLNIFFARINKASAVTCEGSSGLGGVCVVYCDTTGTPPNNYIPSITVSDCNSTSQQCCVPSATPATDTRCQDAHSGFSCADSTGKTGCFSGLCPGGTSNQCCPPVGGGTGAGMGGAVATGVDCGTGNFEKIGGVCFPLDTGLSNASITTILENLFSWLMGLFTTLAVMAFVVSGVQYLVAAGNEDIMETAKRNMTYAIIGVLVGLSGFVIVRAIAAALSGTSIFF